MRALAAKFLVSGLAAIMVFTTMAPAAVASNADLYFPSQPVSLVQDTDGNRQYTLPFQMEEDERESRTLTFRNNTQYDYFLDVDQRSGSTGVFSVSNNGARINAYSDLTVTVSAEADREGYYQASYNFDFVAYNNSSVTTFYIDLQADVDGNGYNGNDITLSRTDVDFGSVVEDRTSSTQTVRVYNNSNSDRVFTITDGVDSEWNYSVSPNYSEIPARGSVTFSFNYSPNNVGTDTERFGFRVGSDYYYIDLEGRGVSSGGSSGGTNREALITDFRVTDNNDLYDSPASVSVYFELDRSAYLDMELCDEDGRNCSRVFSNRYYTESSAGRTRTYTLPYTLNYSRAYQLKLTADADNSSYEDTDTVYIGRSNRVNPRPPYDPAYGGGCAGFADVAPGTEFCAAVEFAVEEGIFRGDDVTYGGVRVLRPDDTLNRAEAVFVLTRAADVAPNNSVALPFYDVNMRDSYAASGALGAAVKYGAIKGYTDGTFRPAQTMNRAEFYKAFLAFMQNSGRLNGVIFNYNTYDSGFSDVTWAGMRWVVPYTNFAARYFDRSPEAARWFGTSDLRNGNGRFQPTKGITRGHIIELIYAMEKRNMLK